ncbi:hypothetical protein [Enterococcus sp. AZ109]|uniref:hypothetical protein n=1 Tax=Enterococcus sp. AZ109 TaxID=2774634 RepID=UPI003F2662CD
MERRKRKVVRFAMIVALLASVGSGLGSLLLGNGITADAVQTISANPVADETSERSITLWKYEVKDLSELGNRGDGKETTVDKVPLSGITFTIQKVIPNKVTPGGDETVPLINPLVQKEGTHYTLDSAVWTVTTKGDGSATQALGKGTAVMVSI